MTLPLLHSPARIMQAALVGAGLAGDPGVSPLPAWPAYCANEPDVPDECLTVYDTQGYDDGRLAITGELVEFPGLSLRIRAGSYETGYAKADAVGKAIDALPVVEVDLSPASYVLLSVKRNGPPIPLNGPPGSKRKLFTQNMIIVVRRLS